MAESGNVDRDGFRLGWLREGRGTPMMVLGAQRFYSRFFPESLREHFEFVFCDLRQWVPSPDGFDLSTITRDTFSDDVEAVRRAVGLDRPIVAGHSQHGAIALEYACCYPEAVRGVLAVAPVTPAGSRNGLESSTDFFERDADPGRRAAHEYNLATRPVPEVMRTSQEFIDTYVANDALAWYDPTFNSRHLWDGVQINFPVLEQVFTPEAFGGYRIDPFDLPVFLALGRYDYGIPFYVWEEPKKNLSNLRYKLYDKSGHHPPYEQPNEFTADVVDWAANCT